MSQRRGTLAPLHDDMRFSKGAVSCNRIQDLGQGIDAGSVSARRACCIVTTGIPFFQPFPLRIGHVRTMLHRYNEVTMPNGQVNGRQRPKGTATPSTQWIYSSVSEASLQKTGVFLNSAGDF